MAATDPESWLLLIHHIPPKPGYLRAKAAKRLAALGAVALKNAVYALPEGPGRAEDLTWLAQEIEDSGGRAFVCKAGFLAGLDDARVRALFSEAREADYRALAESLRLDAEALDPQDPDTLRSLLARGRKEFEAARAVDFFGAPSRGAVEGLLAGLEQRLERSGPAEVHPLDPASLRGRTWVTRSGVHVDRMASAWLVRRFLDPGAVFRFVPGPTHKPGPGEIRFDMRGGEFTHQGPLCTFEVLAARFLPRDQALASLAQVIHDIDLKEETHGRPETAGLRAALDALCLTVPGDMERIERAAPLLDLLYEHFRLARQGS